MANFKFGIDGANTMNCNLAEEIRILSELGYGYIEVRDYKLLEYLKTHAVEDLVKLFDENELAPICMSAIELKLSDSKSEIKQMEQSADWILKTGSEIGCKTALAAHLPPTPELSREEVIERVVEDLLHVSDIAKKYSMRVCYEFLGSMQCPIYNIEDTMKVLEKVNRDNIGWLFDIYHFHLTDGSIESIKKSNIDKLFLVHLTDVKDLPVDELYVPNSHRAMPGEGIAETEEILRTLKKTGFNGPFVIELYDEDYMSWKPEEFAKCAKEKAHNVLNKYFIDN